MSLTRRRGRREPEFLLSGRLAGASGLVAASRNGGRHLLLMALAWPKFWPFINFDDTPMNDYQSTLLLAASAVAVLNASRGARMGDRRERHGWLLISLAFLYLALDEQFMIHETVRNQVLRPYGRLSLLPWVAAGDYLPLLYASVGVALLPRIWPFVARSPGTRWRFAAAILLAGTAVTLDSIDWHEPPGHWLGREQFIEECMEAMAYTLFVASFLMAREPRR